MTNKELNIEIKRLKAEREARKAANTVKDDFPKLKRTWRFQEWTGLSHIKGGVK